MAVRSGYRSETHRRNTCRISRQPSRVAALWVPLRGMVSGHPWPAASRMCRSKTAGNGGRFSAAAEKFMNNSGQDHVLSDFRSTPVPNMLRKQFEGMQLFTIKRRHLALFFSLPPIRLQIRSIASRICVSVSMPSTL